MWIFNVAKLLNMPFNDNTVINNKISYRWQTARRIYRSVKVTKHATIPYVRYGFLLVCYSNFVPKTQ